MIAGQNRMILPIATIVLTLIVLFAFTTCSTAPSAPQPGAGSPRVGALAAEADTPAEVLKSVSGQLTENSSKLNNMEQLVGELQDAVQRQGKDIAQVRSQPPPEAPEVPPADVAVRQQQVLQAENEQLRREMQLLREQVAAMANGQPAAAAPPIPGSDIPGGLGYDQGGSLLSGVPMVGDLIGQPRAPLPPAQLIDPDAFVPIVPLDQQGTPAAAPGMGDFQGSSLGAGSSANEGYALPSAAGAPPPQAPASYSAPSVPPQNGAAPAVLVKRVYTIPANATLLGATSMTALIGRVASGGALQDPYQFKVLTGPENLASNGIYIPGLVGMVWTGTAYGDWGLSCVRGTLTSVTYTFEDGTIRSTDLRRLQQESQITPDTSSPSSNALGWITDERGICIEGERITNAGPVIAARVGVSALEVAAKAYSESETTTLLNPTTGTGQRLLTGDAAKFGAFSGIAGGAEDLKAWLDSRLGQIFDAVYAPPSSALVLHINYEIPIDYDPSGRKVAHDDAFAAGTAPVLD